MKIKRSLDINTNEVGYSQFGEDIVLKHIFGNKYSGFYVDIGAFNPKLFSNTACFYQKGWKGINIEPVKKQFELFEKYRKRDINLNCAVGEIETKKTIFVNGACSSFNSKSLIKEEVNVLRLETILDKYCFEEIDFFDVDAEGNDFEVLKSNNWDKYKPKVILVENDKSSSLMNNYLEKLGYVKKYQIFITAIYILEKDKIK